MSAHLLITILTPLYALSADVENIVARHDEVATSVARAEVEFEWDGIMWGAPVRVLHGVDATRSDHGTAHWKRHGNSLWVYRTISSEISVIDWRQDLSSIVILNKDYLIVCPDLKTKYIYKYGLESGSLSKVLQRRLDMNTLPHIFLYGFGTGSEPLRRAFENTRQVADWTCRIAEDGNYQISRIHNKGAISSIEYTLDAESFLLTKKKVRAEAPGSDVVIDLQIAITKLPSGEVVPQKITEHRTSWSQDIRITSFKFSPKWNPEQFSDTAIPGLEDHWRMLEIPAAGRTRSFLFRNGLWEQEQLPSKPKEKVE